MKLRLLISLAICCAAMMVEVDSQQLFPRVLFLNQTIANHSYVNISTIGSGDEGNITCETDLETCCSSTEGPHRGDWYFPNGDQLHILDYILENRIERGVELHRVNQVYSPTGLYRCGIPTNAVHSDSDISVRENVYIGIYTADRGNVNISDEVALDVTSDLNGPSPPFTLTCISTDGPATTVTWTRDSTILTEGTETVLNDTVTAQYIHTLTLTGRLPGLYTCTVSNNKPSSDSQSINLEGALPPSNLAAIRSSATSIDISWTPPSPLGDTTGYIIYYMTTTSGYFNGTAVLPDNAMASYVIGGLVAHAGYIITIVGTSQHFPSDPVSVGVLENVQVLRIDQRQVEIVWAAQNSPPQISGYNLSCTPTFESLPRTFPSAGTLYRVEGLTPGTEYICSLVSFNTAGSGTPNVFSFSTLEDYVSVRIQLSGVFMCSEWVKYFTSEKTQAVTNQIAAEVASICNCSFTIQEISNGILLCRSEGPQNTVLFDGALSGTASMQSSSLLDIVTGWQSESPVFNVLGVIMGAGEDCSTVVTEIAGNGVCTMIETNKGSPCNQTLSSSSVGASIGAGAGVAVGIILLSFGSIVLIFVIFRCRQSCMRRYKIKKDIMNTTMSTDSNMAYGMSVRKSKETAFTDPDDTYDVIANPHRHDATPPTLPPRYTDSPEQKAAGGGGAAQEYEVSIAAGGGGGGGGTAEEYVVMKAGGGAQKYEVSIAGGGAGGGGGGAGGRGAVEEYVVMKAGGGAQEYEVSRAGGGAGGRGAAEEYEVNTPVHLRKMKSQKQPEKKEEEEEKELYLQIPSSL